MTCVCGHSDDLHDIIDYKILGKCEVCTCTIFVEDIDEDELEGE